MVQKQFLKQVQKRFRKKPRFDERYHYLSKPPMFPDHTKYVNEYIITLTENNQLKVEGLGFDFIL